MDESSLKPAPRSAAPKRKEKRAPKPLSPQHIMQELRCMALTSFHFMGGVKYLNKLAEKRPDVYMNFIGKFVNNKADEERDGDIRIVIQQINVAAQPVPGVINSPIAGHIAPVRLVANSGEVIDAEPAPDGN